MTKSATSQQPEVEDSASQPRKTDQKDQQKKPSTKGPSKGGKNKGKPYDKPANPNTSKQSTEKTGSKSTPGFAEGNTILQNYGLSVSGRKERILSSVKTDKYFHLVEQCWHSLVQTKPHIVERYSYAEFRHASALQLYHRIESVKFDALGIKPSAPTRIPLPRNTRVFQPIWSVLANVGIVDDDDLRVIYVPDSALPSNPQGDSDKDLENLISCTLYDWNSSWDDVLAARSERSAHTERIGIDFETTSNETPASRAQQLAMIRDTRNAIKAATQFEKDNAARIRIIDGRIYKLPVTTEQVYWEDASPADLNTKITNAALSKHPSEPSSSALSARLEQLFVDAKKEKKKMTTVKFDVSTSIESYRLADHTFDSDPGAYGAWLHWDPQLWLEYEQIVEILSIVAMFSLSMPNDSSGTYMWLLPVESREKDEATVSARLPKASIPPVTWTMSLLLQMSTLPLERRTTFYTETDRLSNVLGLRQRYIRAAIKDPTAVEQFGTY